MSTFAARVLRALFASSVLGGHVAAAAPAGIVTMPSGTLLIAESGESRLPALRPGTVVEVPIRDAAYVGDQLTLLPGTRVRCVVDAVRRTAVGKTGAFRKILRLAADPFADRGRPVETVALHSSVLIQPDGAAVPVALSLLAAQRIRDRGQARSTRFLFRVDAPSEVPASQAAHRPAIAPGGSIRTILLTTLSARSNRAGDPFQVYVYEPVRLPGGAVLSKGTLIEGHVAQRTPPRMLSRPGRMSVAFHAMVPPAAPTATLSLSLQRLAGDAADRTRLGPEGVISGGPVGLKKTLLDLAVTYAIGKLADDLLEEGIKAGFTAAASGTARTAARYVGIGTGLAWFLTHRGRDAVLPRYSEMDLVLNRPLPVDSGTAPHSHP